MLQIFKMENTEKTEKFYTGMEFFEKKEKEFKEYQKKLANTKRPSKEFLKKWKEECRRLILEK